MLLRLGPRLAPAGIGGAAHPQGPDHLALVPIQVRHALRLGRGDVGLLQGRPGQRPVGQGGDHQDRPAKGRDHTQQRMKDVNRRQEQRRPRQVECRQQHGRGDQPLDPVQIAHPAGRCRRFVARNGAFAKGRGKDPPLHPVLEPRGDPPHHAGTDEIHETHQQEQEHHQHEQRRQRFHRTGCQHPVIDLQHEQRSGQHQQVHDCRKQRDRAEQGQAGRPRPAQFLGAFLESGRLAHSFILHRSAIVAALPQAPRASMR